MNNTEKREVFQGLRDLKLLEYGATIEVKEFRDFFNISYPETAKKREFDTLALEELGCADFIRNALLNEGKYFKMSGGFYRVLLPSENMHQVELMMKSSDKRLKRAIKLSENTPVEFKEVSNKEMLAKLKIGNVRY